MNVTSVDPLNIGDFLFLAYKALGNKTQLCLRYAPEFFLEFLPETSSLLRQDLINVRLSKLLGHFKA